MKPILIPLLIVSLILPFASIASADGNADRTRAVITRTTDINDRADRSRGGAAEEGTAESDEADDDGVTFDVSYNSDGELEITFTGGGNPGDVDITVIINGETVSNSGGSNSSGGNTSSDGEDGADGQDGDQTDAAEDEEEDVVEEAEEEETDSRFDSRPSRDNSDRPRR